MIVILGLAVISFVLVFNFAADTISASEIDVFLDPTVLGNYLGGYDSSVIGVYKTGRNFEAMYAWDKNLQDPLTFLFGRGIGSRAESSVLGISGEYSETSLDSTSLRKSLAVLLLETGFIGMLTLAFLCLGLIMTLYKIARPLGNTDMAAIQYGLLVFSALWPLWLWYQPIWSQPIPMLLYWTSLGFALSPHNIQVVQEFYDVS
jgi:hypothetical protein